MLQGWLIRNCLAEIYRDWLHQAVLGGAVVLPEDYWTDPKKYENVRFKPRGWNWIDPTKEVNAFKTAVRAGFMTVSDVIGQTGSGTDAEDVFKGRRQELDMMEDLDLVFDTDPAQVTDTGVGQTTPMGEAATDGTDPQTNPPTNSPTDPAGEDPEDSVLQD